MANFLDVLHSRQAHGHSSQSLVDFIFKSRRGLFAKDLKAHFGCVNALAFSQNGRFLASGGDDRRILLWEVAKTLNDSKSPTKIMKATHESNVFCIDFDSKLVTKLDPTFLAKLPQNYSLYQFRKD